MENVNNIDDELIDMLSEDLDDADIYAAIALAKISAAITNKRAYLNMNQKQFAEYMGVSQAMVSKWESGEYNFTIQTIASISSKLNYSFEVNMEEKILEYNAACDFVINEHGFASNNEQEVLPIAS